MYYGYIFAHFVPLSTDKISFSLSHQRAQCTFLLLFRRSGLRTSTGFGLCVKYALSCVLCCYVRTVQVSTAERGKWAPCVRERGGDDDTNNFLLFAVWLAQTPLRDRTHSTLRESSSIMLRDRQRPESLKGPLHTMRERGKNTYFVKPCFFVLLTSRRPPFPLSTSSGSSSSSSSAIKDWVRGPPSPPTRTHTYYTRTHAPHAFCAASKVTLLLPSPSPLTELVLHDWPGLVWNTYTAHENSNPIRTHTGAHIKRPHCRVDDIYTHIRRPAGHSQACSPLQNCSLNTVMRR